jgi:hypothetical protein
MGSHLAVKWRTGDLAQAEAAYKELDLQALRDQAVRMRQGLGGAGPRNPGLSRTEFLRALGQDLDARRIEFSTISELEDSYLVSGTQRGAYFRENFPFVTLQEESLDRRRNRSAPVAPAATPARSRTGLPKVALVLVVGVLMIAAVVFMVLSGGQSTPTLTPTPTPAEAEPDEAMMPSIALSPVLSGTHARAAT